MSSTPQSCKKAYEILKKGIVSGSFDCVVEWGSHEQREALHKDEEAFMRERHKEEFAALDLLMGTAMATLDDNAEPTNPILCPQCREWCGAEAQFFSDCCSQLVEDL